MSLRLDAMPVSSAPPVDTPCWNSIGVRGDRSCPVLEQHVHCRNCPVYSAAALALLDVEVSAEIVADHTRHFAKPKVVDESETLSAIIFRIGAEWLALPTSVVAEVAELRPIRTVPHRRSGLVMGLANVRGELLVCVSLSRLLGLDRSVESKPESRRASPHRLLVVRSGDVRAVLPVDEVFGIHRLHLRELKDAPTTVAKAPTAHSKAVVIWSGHSVGLLDDQRLLRSLRGSLG